MHTVEGVGHGVFPFATPSTQIYSLDRYLFRFCNQTTAAGASTLLGYIGEDMKAGPVSI